MVLEQMSNLLKNVLGDGAVAVVAAAVVVVGAVAALEAQQLVCC